MTREEAIKTFEDILQLSPTLDETGCSVTEAMKVALSALRPVTREQAEKFKEYFDELYGKGLEVHGWHMNGEAKPFDDFYEAACEYAGL
jgi:hypothetical protein